jgi:EthD domain
MTTRFLALHEASADPEAFGQHHREVHIPLARQLPALRRYTLGGDAAAIRGAPYYSSPSWNGTRWKTWVPPLPRPRAAPPPTTRHACNSSPQCAA